MTTSWTELDQQIATLADRWREDRAQRQHRTELDAADFAALREAGYLQGPVPAEVGGLWDGPESARPLCEVLRTMARGDGAVALVASMHPAVLSFWLFAPDPAQPRWEAQRRAVFASALDGRQWGTITSEPGSGGDISRTRSIAERDPDAEPLLEGDPYRITGDKHFGSGSGITDYMITTARRAGLDHPDLFILDVAGHPWDGSTGYELRSAWDGMGMAATQSHAMRLEAAPAALGAWDGDLDRLTLGAAPLNTCLFTAVVLGIVDEAVDDARRRLAPRAESLRSFEEVEWTRAETDHWLARQAYEGALQAIEAEDPASALYAGLRAKYTVAELSEQVLLRLSRVLGGGTFSRSSPFSHWFEDVRALGFLRPPWGLASDALFATSFNPT